MNSNDLSKKDWNPLPPVRFIELSRWIGWLSILFSIYYLYHFIRSLLGALINNLVEQGIPIYIEVVTQLICFVSLLIGGILLLIEKRLGKLLIQIAGFAGVITILLYGVWSLTLLSVQPYDQYPMSVLENFVRLIVRYLIRFGFPIVVCFLLTRKSN